jgi:chaperonin cofactor prefoldin
MNEATKNRKRYRVTSMTRQETRIKERIAEVKAAIALRNTVKGLKDQLASLEVELRKE